MSLSRPADLQFIFRLLPFIIILVVSGCATGGSSVGGVSIPAKEVTVDGIRELLRTERFSEALQDSVRAEAAAPSELRSELVRLHADAVLGMKTAYNSAVESGDFRLALVSARSLSALGEAADGQLSESALLLGEADSLLKADGNAVAALAVFLLAVEADSRLNSPSIASGDFKRYAEAAEGGAGRETLRSLVNAMERRGFSVPDEMRTRLGTIPSSSEAVNGTAMILVNCGMRIEGGVGYPDRVIGSGFFIDPRGYLVTNYHVISSEVDPSFEGYSRLFINLPGEKTRIPARVVGYDRVFDIALLKAETAAGSVFSFIPEGEPLDPGERIFAIGSPVGLGSTITSGIVSANGRRFLSMGDAVQIDVPINPGNSGGPLLNERRELVGYVFAGIEQFEGLNFAIPAHWVAPFLPDLYKDGEVVHSWMGAAAAETPSGLEISYLTPDAGAVRAGMAVGDLLVSLNDIPLHSLADVQKLLLSYDPSTLVRVKFRRNAIEHTAFINLGKRPFSPVEDALEKDLPKNVFSPLFGMRIREAGKELWGPTFVIEKVYAGSAADETGLSKDDPFTIQSWKVLNDDRVALLRIRIKKRKAGFLESSVQLGNLLDVDNFF